MKSILGTCADSKAFVKGPEVHGALGRTGWLGMQVRSKGGSVEVAAVADDSQVQSGHCRKRHLRTEAKEKGVLANAHTQCFVIISLLALEDCCKFKTSIVMSLLLMCHSFASVCRNHFCYVARILQSHT